MADPRTHPVGFLLDEAEIGRAYCWFTDDRAALEWCVTHVLIPRARDAGDDKAYHDLHQRLESARRQGFGLTTMAATLNAITEPSIRIVWCGPFEELRDGRTPHARYVCAEFWEREYAVGEPTDPIRDEEETERQEPIPDNMLPAFIALLSKLA